MRPATDIIKRVLQTEKGGRMASHDQYLIEAALDANKAEIREAVETLFKVTVKNVNTMVTHGKRRRLQARWGRRPNRKKAIVTLAKGQKIEVSSK